MLASGYDIKRRRIPNWISAAAFLIALFVGIYQGALACAMLATLISMVLIGLPNLLRSGAIGAGDVKLVGAVGALLGTSSMLLVVGAGAAGSLAVLAVAGRFQGNRSGSSSIPFAPCLLAGLLLAGGASHWAN